MKVLSNIINKLKAKYYKLFSVYHILPEPTSIDIDNYAKVVEKVRLTGDSKLYNIAKEQLQLMNLDLEKRNNASNTWEKLRKLESEQFTLEHGLIAINDIVSCAQNTNDTVLIQKALKTQKDLQEISINQFQKALNEDPMISGLDVLGFKQKNTQISWATLGETALSPAVRPVHKRLIEYMAAFARPQDNKYTQGYFWERTDGKKISQNELETIVPELNKFVEQCGVKKDHVAGNFSQFIREWTFNTLAYDHAPVEIVWSKGQTLYGFRNLDAETIKLADTYFPNKDNQHEEKMVDGELPVYCQVFNQLTYAEFYNWEMWLAKRNPIASVKVRGYGRSEIEDLVLIITAIMNSIKYNANQFIDGIPASSLMWLKGTARTSLNELERQLKAYRQNVNSATLIGISTEEKPEIIKTRDSNKDMEFGNLLSYLISIVCSMYNLIPEAVGLKSPLSANVNYESGMGDRVKHVLNEAIKPLLTIFESGFNEKIVSQLYDGVYRFRFGGMGEDMNEEQKRLIERSKIVPIDSILEELGLPASGLPKGWILSSEYIQSMQYLSQMQAMNEASSNEQQQKDNEKPNSAEDIEKAINDYFEL